MAAFAQSHVNNGIPEIFSSLDYITFQTVLDMVVRNAIDHEKRLKDAFRYIPWLPTSNGSWGFIGKINFTMRPVYHSATYCALIFNLFRRRLSLDTPVIPELGTPRPLSRQLYSCNTSRRSGTLVAYGGRKLYPGSRQPKLSHPYTIIPLH
jgi:hypothetical protein